MANNLPIEKKVAVISMLSEGASIRGIERITGINRNTIMGLGVRVGQACAKIQDEKMRGKTLRQPLLSISRITTFASGILRSKQLPRRPQALKKINGPSRNWLSVAGNDCDMSKPDPEQFSKVVLWHLAGLQADVANLQLRLDAIQIAVQNPASKEFVEEAEKQAAQTQVFLYQQSCNLLGLSGEPPSASSAN